MSWSFREPSGGSNGCARRGHVDAVQPAPLVGGLAREEAEEGALEALGDRSAFARADRKAVHRANRSDLHRGAREESLIRNVEQLARDCALADLESALARQTEHGVASD